MSNNLKFRLMWYHTKIEKINNIRNYIFGLACVSLFFNICIYIGAEHGNVNDTVSQIIYLVLFSLLQIGSFLAELFFTKKNWLYEYEVYRIESEDLERKKRVADIKNEILPEYMLNKKIDPPEAMHISIKKYIIVFALNLAICIIWFCKIR